MEAVSWALMADRTYGTDRTYKTQPYKSHQSDRSSPVGIYAALRRYT
jgi:hypothetical protein